MVWTHFWDMHSGGGLKESFAHCFIEAPQAEAVSVFYARFGHNPERVSCTCCGDDYSISEHASLAQATGHHRNCDYLQTPKDPETGRYVHPDDEWFKEHYYLDPEDIPEAERRGWTVERNSAVEFGEERGYDDRRFRYIPLDEYLTQDDVVVIRADKITDDERSTDVPEQGYVWAG